MSKNIFCAIVILAISSAMGKDYWQCDSAGKFSCSSEQTCCRNRVASSGWACFPTKAGVCCSDGISVCPSQTVCNLREKRCDKQTALSFLEQVEVVPAHENHSEVKVNSDVPMKFVTGFLEGLNLFKNLTHWEDCKPDAAVFQDVNDIVQLLKNLTLNSNYSQVIQTLIVKVSDIYERVSNTTEICAAYAAEVQKVLVALKDYTSGTGYYTRLATHALINFGEIFFSAEFGFKALSAHNYEEAGKIYGNLTRFVVFWDFEAQAKSLFSVVSNTTVDDALKFALGFNDGFSLFNNLPHQNQCKVDDDQFYQDVLEVVALVKDIHLADLPKVLPILLQKVVDIYDKISKISDDCKALSDEVKLVAEGLQNDLKATGFYTKLTFHSISNIGEITSKVTKSVSDMKSADYAQAGHSVGDLIRFVLFWDYQKPTFAYLY